MSDTLYSINEEIIAFTRKWEASEIYDEEKGDGTISFNAHWEFERLYEKLNKKMNWVVGYIRSLEDNIVAIERKEAELKAMKEKKQKKVDSMIGLLKFIMEKQNITEIDTGENIIKLKEWRGSVDVLDEALVPNEYKLFTFDSGKLPKGDWDKLLVALKEWRWGNIEVLPKVAIDKAGIQTAFKTLEKDEFIPGVVLKKEKSVVII